MEMNIHLAQSIQARNELKRIANVQYGKLTKSKMFEMYGKENENFEKMLGRHTDYAHYDPMFKYLETILISD